MQPDRNIYCHRTGFKKTCHGLVTKGHCNRYRSLPFFNKSTGEQFERWDCVDNLAYQMEMEHAAQLDGMRSEFNALRNEMAATREAAVVGAIGNINQQIGHGLARMTQSHAPVLDNGPAPKLIGNGSGE